MNGFVNRLAIGGTIDRSKELKFWFNGKAYTGYAGDTLASALLANGVMEIARSVRHDRPRGIVGAGRDEPNAYVIVDQPKSGERLACAATLELYDGLRARTANRGPAPIGWAEERGKSRPAGRNHAGDYGKPIRSIVERPAETRFDTCDVLIVGGGPAGLAAARTAASASARVVLVEAGRAFGGELMWDDTAIDGAAPQRWVASVVAELDKLPNVRLLRNTAATGYFEQNLVHLAERIEDAVPPGLTAPRRSGFRLWKMRARQVVLATGSHEQILVMPDNDVPGVMLASAVRHYLRRYGVIAGRQAVLVTNNDSAYRTAIDLFDVGVRVMAVVDIRESPQTGIPAILRERGVEIIPANIVSEIHGKSHITGVVVSSVDERGQPRPRGSKEIDCDLLCMSGGWNPDLHLFNESGGEILFDETAASFLPGEATQDVTVVGAAAGHALIRDCIQSGYEAGRDAAEALKCGIATLPASPKTDEAEPTPPRLPYRPPLGAAKSPAEKWIDLAADVTLADMEAAAKNNFLTLDQISARTGLFRGPEDALSCALIPRVLIGETLDLKPDGLGERPVWPVRPVPFQAFRPVDPRRRFRTLPLLQSHIDTGVVFDTYGPWTLPAYYARQGEGRAEAVRRETTAGWNGATLFDRSAGGKIEIKGRDAAEFLNRMVTADVNALAEDRIVDTYLLDDAGMIIDRCRLTRLGETFLLLTGLGQGGAIERWFQEWHQLGWNALAVFIADVSAQWTALSISGPRAAEVAAHILGDGKPPAPGACVETTLSDHPCRIFAPASLDVAEVEIHVPTAMGAGLWTRLGTIGTDAGLTPVGLEARNAAEIQSGNLPLHVAYGARWSPCDFGSVDGLVTKREDFIGRRMALNIATSEVVRPQLVGIVPEDEDLDIPPGALLVPGKAAKRSAGYVIASQISPKLGQSAAIGFLDAGRGHIGEKISVFFDGKARPARVMAAGFPSETKEVSHA